MVDPEVSAQHQVLIIDDDKFVVSALRRILERAGYATVSAADGREALDLLHATAARPRLILLDWRMPVMSGEEFRIEQLKDSSLTNIPVVVISAEGAVRDRAIELRTAGFLQKPIGRDVLLETVKTHCF